MADQSSRDKEHWRQLRQSLVDLLQILEANQLDLLRFGKAYAQVAVAVRDAVTLEGRSSMRFEVVARALDLRTPKSVLQRFLDDTNRE